MECKQYLKAKRRKRMNINLKVQPTAVALSDAESTPKPDWHAPVITRIDIKRTMTGTGSGPDGITRSIT